ncbi:Transcriptional regulatory protein, C terminal [Mycobacterium sp. 455mf]|nr:Transcriptional regulatory protein, C terminal [Mycobacterium sp. 455mf]
MARLRGLLRRSSHTTPPADETLEVGDMVLDGASREVTRAGEPINLTVTEFELLRYLMRNPRRALSSLRSTGRQTPFPSRCLFIC